MSPGNRFLSRHTPHGVLNDRKRQIRKAKPLALEVRNHNERISDDRHRWNTAPLKFKRVVDTPRRARPSIAKGDDSRVGLRR